MKMTKGNYLILFVLALIFSLPGLTAYISYLHPQWFLTNTINKGELLKPSPLFAEIAEGKPKWRLVYWYPEQCKEACLQQVDKLARVRLALGRHLYEVDEWLVVSQENQQDDEAISKILQEQDIHLLQLSHARLARLPVLSDKPKTFIANAKGSLILAYQEQAKPEDIYQDLKQLLKKSG